MTMTDQARQNRAYVRRLLDEKEPDFAAVLEIVERQLCASVRRPGHPARSRHVPVLNDAGTNPTMPRADD